ncbi:MAG: hypothetical protein JNK11_21190 [Alphaproteobacteria bacterium]|nr:hypothetical protein [Alphaproteobacteria bacterium]
MPDDARHGPAVTIARWMRMRMRMRIAVDQADRLPVCILRTAAAILLVVLSAQGPIAEAIEQRRVRALAASVADDAAGMPIMQAILERHPRAIEDVAVWRNARRKDYVLPEGAVAVRLAQAFDIEFDRGLSAASVPALRHLAAAMADLAEGATPAPAISDPGCQARMGTLATGDSAASRQVAALIRMAPASHAPDEAEVGDRALETLRSVIEARGLDDCAALADLYRSVAEMPDADVRAAVRALLSPHAAP